MLTRKLPTLRGFSGSSTPFHQASRLPPVRITQLRHRSIAPQFLLDDYLPRYQLLSPLQEAKKRAEAYAHLRNCNLCPRLCGVNRFEKTGTCLIGSDVVVNTIVSRRSQTLLLHHG